MVQLTLWEIALGNAVREIFCVNYFNTPPRGLVKFYQALKAGPDKYLQKYEILPGLARAVNVDQ